MDAEISVKPATYADGRWKPGQSGNPKGGLTRDRSITNWIHKLSTVILRDGKSYAELAAHAVYDACINHRNMHAAKIIWDRLDPAPTSNVTINQLVLREDLNHRLNALKEGEIDKLLPED